MKLIFILLFSLFLFGCNPVYYVYIGDDNTAVNVDVAKSGYEQRKGLMFVSSMDENSGMMFVFDDDEPRHFWMKNTLIPLDMIFIDSSGIITGILEAEPCETDACEIYNGYGKYVLEVNKGFSVKHNITQGDFVVLSMIDKSFNNFINESAYGEQYEEDKKERRYPWSRWT